MEKIDINAIYNKRLEISNVIMIVLELLLALNSAARDIIINNDQWRNKWYIINGLTWEVPLIICLIFIARKGRYNSAYALLILYIVTKSILGLYLFSLSINFDVIRLSQISVGIYIIFNLIRLRTYNSQS